MCNSQSPTLDDPHLLTQENITNFLESPKWHHTYCGPDLQSTSLLWAFQIQTTRVRVVLSCLNSSVWLLLTASISLGRNV